MQINFVYISPVFEKFELSNMLFLKQKAQQNSKEKRHMCFLSRYIQNPVLATQLQNHSQDHII